MGLAHENTWTSLLVIIFSAFGYHLVSNFRRSSIDIYIYEFIIVNWIFMNPKRSKNNRWVGKSSNISFGCIILELN